MDFTLFIFIETTLILILMLFLIFMIGGAGLLAFQTFKIEGLPLGAIKPWLRSLD